MEDLMQMDLYELIGTIAAASTAEIKTAYRKKALSCHPDKNPDNPRAAELFHQLSRALEILTDDSAKAAYDKVLRARHLAKIRESQYDSKRKKLKVDLEAREEAYRQTQGKSSTVKSDEQRLKAEIERLRREGSKQVEEEVALVRQQIYNQLYGSATGAQDKSCGANSTKVKIKWKAAPDDPDNGGYDYNSLHQILSKHGDIAVLVVSLTKKGSALVEYKNHDSAETAVLIEIGLSKNPLKLQGLWQTKKCGGNFKSDSSHIPRSFTVESERTRKPSGVTFPSYASTTAHKFENQERSCRDDADFESLVLENMKRAEEHKRSIERLKSADEKS